MALLSSEFKNEHTAHTNPASFFRLQKKARINVLIAHQFRQFKTVLKNEDAAISNIRIIGRQSVSCPITVSQADDRNGPCNLATHLNDTL